MKKIVSVSEMQDARLEWNSYRVGFIPTMGALHDGHLALIERARHECDRVVVSLFVNPTQFNDPSDFKNYPKPLEEDLAKLRMAEVDAAFIPNADEMYADKFRYVVHEKEESEVLCGPGRPGHFDGVLTVVLKLLQIVRPQRAYFGEKDFQQLRLIQGMAQAFFLPTEIVPCPTLREPTGLAMSSRNRRLSPAEHEFAPRLYEILRTAADVSTAKKQMLDAGFDVEYVEEHWGRRFVAARLGNVRLIDNVEL